MCNLPVKNIWLRSICNFYNISQLPNDNAETPTQSGLLQSPYWGLIFWNSKRYRQSSVLFEIEILPCILGLSPFLVTLSYIQVF
jgi:hypothetical protein